MFEDSLVESAGILAKRNPWTTAFSFLVQMSLAGLLLLLPLIYTEVLPKQQLTSFLETPAQPPSPAPRSLPEISAAKHTRDANSDVLQPPTEIPRRIVDVNDGGQPSAGGTEAPDLVPGVPDGVPDSLIDTIIRDVPAAVPKITAQKVRVSSGVAQGLLVREVAPQYPTLARQARIQGTVVLQAVIGKDGTVQNLRVLNGHPMLVRAAMDAVRQWRYKPYYLNGEPVEVDTQINVNFTLSGG